MTSLVHRRTQRRASGWNATRLRSPRRHKAKHALHICRRQSGAGREMETGALASDRCAMRQGHPAPCRYKYKAGALSVRAHRPGSSQASWPPHAMAAGARPGAPAASGASCARCARPALRRWRPSARCQCQPAPGSKSRGHGGPPPSRPSARGPRLAHVAPGAGPGASGPGAREPRAAHAAGALGEGSRRLGKYARREETRVSRSPAECAVSLHRNSERNAATLAATGCHRACRNYTSAPQRPGSAASAPSSSIPRHSSGTNAGRSSS